MDAALTLLLAVGLMQGHWCKGWSVSLPEKVEVVVGSILTIPCSFDIDSQYQEELTSTCQAVWKSSGAHHETTTDSKLTGTIKKTEDLTKKNCTTTFDNLHRNHSDTYYFRLHCPKNLKYTYKDKSVKIVVKDSPKNTKVSVSPSGPVPEKTNVTLTCSSDANPPVKNYTWYRADGDQETVIGTGHVLTITALVSKTIFCKAENDVGLGLSKSYELDVQFPPQILLSSSGCNKTADLLNCSCEIAGNPSPSVHWYLDGLPVNQSDKLLASTESINDTYLRSIITVNREQERETFNFICRGFNSLGSSSHQFCVNSLQISAESQDRVLFLIFISTSAVLFVVCLLLLVSRALNKHHKINSHLTGKTNTAASGQRFKGDENETSIEGFYINCSETMQGAAARPVPGSGLNRANFPEFGEEDDLIYGNVN